MVRLFVTARDVGLSMTFIKFFSEAELIRAFNVPDDSSEKAHGK